MIRLQKYLADAGIASRRKAEELIVAGEVTVNGEVVTELGTKVNPQQDKVKYKGKIVLPGRKTVVYVFHKPLGVLSAVSDQKGRKVIADFFKKNLRLYPVGRLDINTEGLILVTNDGDLTYRLTHPKFEVEKVYEVIVPRSLDPQKKTELEKGCDIGPYAITGSKIKMLKRDPQGFHYLVVIHEGKNRQVRHMFEYAGVPVKKLKRIAVGEIRLGELRPGEHRTLSKKELVYLQKIMR